MEVFIVQKEGVYIQGILGVFLTDQEALDCAVKAIAQERDDYHTFDVRAFPMGQTMRDHEGVQKHHVVRKRGQGIFVDGQLRP